MCPSVLSVGLWENHHLHQQPAHHPGPRQITRGAAPPPRASLHCPPAGLPQGQGEGEQEEEQIQRRRAETAERHAGGGGETPRSETLPLHPRSLGNGWRMGRAAILLGSPSPPSPSPPADIALTPGPWCYLSPVNVLMSPHFSSALAALGCLRGDPAPPLPPLPRSLSSSSPPADYCSLPVTPTILFLPLSLFSHFLQPCWRKFILSSFPFTPSILFVACSSSRLGAASFFTVVRAERGAKLVDFHVVPVSAVTPHGRGGVPFSPHPPILKLLECETIFPAS